MEEKEIGVGVTVHNNKRHSTPYAAEGHIHVEHAHPYAAEGHTHPAGYAGPTIQVSAAPYPGSITTRGLGVVYQNTTGKPMKVKIVSTCSSTTTLHAYSDSSNPPTTKVDGHASPTPYETNVTIDVLPGNYYNASWTAGTPTLVAWVETY